MTSAQRPKLAVIAVDVQVPELKTQNLTELLRIQLTKYDSFQMMDRYEIREGLKQANIDDSECYSVSCLVRAGKTLKVDKVVSGSIDKLGESLFIRVRMIDVLSEDIEREISKEFLVIKDKIGPMLTLALNDMMGIPNDKTFERSLTSKSSYESAVNNPHYTTLNLSGPRMGYSFFTGEGAKILKADPNDGGYGGYPALFQFGYQFEHQYLNEGKYQALFEFIPQILGLDQQLFIPSFTVMNGLRNNVNGLEFAVGPTAAFVKEAEYYKTPQGTWEIWSQGIPKSSTTETRFQFDNRGEVRLKSYIVLAAGMSIRSGKLNIPVNAFVIPSRNNTRFGISFGFNARS
ncbi:MAG: hypothetical protein H6608_04650 [Flavobacteriales bacterium]|nr:hypothetical protein [Flavobacteriales bacterium]